MSDEKQSPLDAKEKKGRGRPSAYVPAYCEEVNVILATGLSLTAFAGHIGVSRDTVNEWRRVHPDFSDAVKDAIAKRVLALEQRLLSSSSGPQVTSTIFALKNADPEEWRDKLHTEHSGSVGIRHEDALAELERD